jgi:hypothetical protein|eukprot:7377722-Prymnesium_polylepis.1
MTEEVAAVYDVPAIPIQYELEETIDDQSEEEIELEEEEGEDIEQSAEDDEWDCEDDDSTTTT